MSKNETKKLFEAVDACEAELDKVRSTVDELTVRRSTAVKAIVDALDSKGPFNWKGRLLTIRSRDTKDPDNENVVLSTNYFFVSQGSDVMEIG